VKLERQIHLSIYLNQHGIRAPQILALRNARFIATVIINQQPYPIQLMQHEILSRVQLERVSDATLVLVGELVARLHHVLEEYPAHDAFVADHQKSADEWGERDQGLWPAVQELPELSRLSNEEQLWFRTVDQQAQAFVQKRFPNPAALSLALLHGDLNFEHIQFLNEKTPYVYDFGDMCWGPIAHELAIFFLNIFCDNAISFAHWEEIQRHILTGYNTSRQVSDLDRAMIPVFMVNRALARANYSVELAQQATIAIDWHVLKKTYQLAEYLVNQAEKG
jgi:Ser/Thr protein kinase RdoA (MazF antagonist)